MKNNLTTESHSIAELDTSELNVIFVHSKLDDCGLTTQEFRVYCHLARRAGGGVAFPGVRSIADHCCICKNTVVDVIKTLESLKMITVDKTPGLVTKYRLTKPSKWLPKAVQVPAIPTTTVPNGVMGQTEYTDQIPESGAVPNGVTVCTERSNTTVPNGVTKGDPLKEIQQGDPSSPSAEGIESEYPDGDDTELPLPDKAIVEKGVHKKTITMWSDAYLKRFGIPYLFDGGKDGKAVKTILEAGFTPETFLGLAQQAWGMRNQDRCWNCVTQARSLHGFCHAMTGIVKEIDTEKSRKPF